MYRGPLAANYSFSGPRQDEAAAIRARGEDPPGGKIKGHKKERRRTLGLSLSISREVDVRHATLLLDHPITPFRLYELFY